MWFQWHSSVLVAPVVFQCGLSSGIRVYWQNLVWRSLGHWVRSLPSMRPLMYTTAMVRVVWAKLISFDLQPQIHKNYNGAHIKGTHRVMLKYSHVLRAELASIAEQYTPSKGWIYRDLSTCLLVSRHLVISNWRGCYSACLTICVGRVWAVTDLPVVFQCRLQKLEFLQWHPSVGWIQLSFSSGIPVWGCFN